TLDPAANAVTRPEISPCPWKRGSTFNSRSRGSSPRVAATLCADRQTAAWVRGTIFGRDVLPEVSRMNASSVPDADSPPMSGPLVEPAVAAFPGQRDGPSIIGMPSAWAVVRGADGMSGSVTSADTRRSLKYRCSSVAVKSGLKGTQTAAEATEIM